MLESIKTRGNEKQRKNAINLEKLGKEFRQERIDAEPVGGFRVAAEMAAGIAPSPDRKIYDGQKRATLPGDLVRSEGESATGDQEVDEAYDGSGDTYKLYADIYGRDSLDGNGMTLKSTVHHRRDYDNAFWNGSQMAYGDGDIFEPLTRSLTVIGHELSHGVVQFSGGLVYRDQSGALNEHFADVFGCLTEQYKKDLEASKADWLLGAEIIGPGINGDALRSMKAPGTAYDDTLLGKDPQPFHMDNYVNTSFDNGGVHINSGIPNHAFYLYAMMLGGKAWEKAGHVWYDALQSINNPHATFVNWADETL
ncbi:MAG: M4 family metallopeptidase, partial [Flavobacteriaceae bacterium]